MFKTILASTLAATLAVPAAGAFAATPPDCALNSSRWLRLVRSPNGYRWEVTSSVTDWRERPWVFTP